MAPPPTFGSIKLCAAAPAGMNPLSSALFLRTPSVMLSMARSIITIAFMLHILGYKKAWK
jgi:hypothetical protein